MGGVVKTAILVPLMVLGLLAPKLSALALHLNPNIMAIVICTGTEMVTIHIGADGEPIEVTEAEQTPCVMADPNAIKSPEFARWTKAPRSYRVAFVDIHNDDRSQAEVGLLPDLRGPPSVI